MDNYVNKKNWKIIANNNVRRKHEGRKSEERRNLERKKIK